MTQAPSPQIVADSSSAPVHPDPTRIIVPRKHGQVLVEPPLRTLEEALQGGSSGADNLMFAGQPLAPLRSAARRHFLEAANTWALSTGVPSLAIADALRKPWVITGHQVEYYHAGVWAKVLAADELAKRSGAIAFDLLVDHDVVDHLGFDVPEREGDHWQRRPIEWAPSSSIPADGLSSPSAPAFEQWDANLAALPQAQTDSLAFFLSALGVTNEQPYTPWLSRARAAFEHALDIHVRHVPTSLICAGESWHAFLRAWINNADAWTALYNRHLAAYRKRHEIKNPQQPMPDLARQGDTLELPFWIYKIGHPRERLTLIISPSGPQIRHNAELLDLDFVIHHSDFVIRPRALALTMFVRLFLADLFIHGIGGALYDQITDGILAELSAIVPSYGCVSAAWLLPLGQPLEDSDDIAALKWRRHHARHNPQLVIDPFTALKTDVAEMIRERRLLIERIGDSLAAARNHRDARRQRAAWFRELHTLNAALHEKAPRVLQNLDHQLNAALDAREQNKVLLWREYFFALHTTASLQKLIATIHAM